MTTVPVHDEDAFLTNLIFGYNDRHSEHKHVIAPASAAYTLDFTAVPAGEVWIIQAIFGRNANSPMDFLLLCVHDGANDAPLYIATSPAAGSWHAWTGSVVCKAGDKVRLYFYNATVGDNLIAHAWGYKMKVA